MSEQEKKFLDEFDRRYTKLLYVIYGLIISIIGAGAIQLVSFGSTKKDVEQVQLQTDFINKNYIPSLFLDGIMQNYNYQMEDLVMTFTGATPEQIATHSKRYIEFQSTMIDNMIKLREGMTKVTRNGVSNKTNSVQ